jgi:hypothetical protein
VKIFNFFVPTAYHVQFRVCLQKFGGLSPLVWEEVDSEQTVVKDLAKLLYRFASCSDNHYFVFPKPVDDIKTAGNY